MDVVVVVAASQQHLTYILLLIFFSHFGQDMGSPILVSKTFVEQAKRSCVSVFLILREFCIGPFGLEHNLIKRLGSLS